ncbi:MAG: hypothetical protein AB1405_11580 [Bdellovibrionota bacterium]
MRPLVRSSFRLAAAFFLASFSACGTMSIYEKGLTRRIEVQKSGQAGPLAAEFARDGGGNALVRITRTGKVNLTRTVHFGTIVMTSSSNPGMEPLEFATAPLYLPIIAPMVLAGIAPPESENVKVPASTRMALAGAPINPAVSYMGGYISRDATSDKDVFQGKPHQMEFSMRLPAGGLKVAYQLVGGSGTRGETLTDPHGEIVLGDVSGATAVRIKADGLDTQVSIR